MRRYTFPVDRPTREATARWYADQLRIMSPALSDEDAEARAADMAPRHDGRSWQEIHMHTPWFSIEDAEQGRAPSPLVEAA